MKVRLIKAGGLLGRTQSAEAELVYRSFAFQKTFEEFFRSLPSGGDPAGARDAFNYILEFNGDRAALPEETAAGSEVSEFIESMKNELKY